MVTRNRYCLVIRRDYWYEKRREVFFFFPHVSCWAAKLRRTRLAQIVICLQSALSRQSRWLSRREGEESGEEDVWTAIKRTTNRNCKPADDPAVVFGLRRCCYSQIKAAWTAHATTFKCRPLKIARLHYQSFPTVSVSPVFGVSACFFCHCALVLPLVNTLRSVTQMEARCWKCLCVSMFVKAVLSQRLMAFRYWLKLERPSHMFLVLSR